MLLFPLSLAWTFERTFVWRNCCKAIHAHGLLLDWQPL